ncbi:hypothetical protein K7H92_15320 [Pseudomonas stutzeri]|nr:hypothetical protein [Stutzerimonas stutzeri]
MSLQTRITALVQAIGADIKALYSGKVGTSDSRLTDAREWTASTVTQAEAEAGTATTRRAWTAQRVFQAIAAWWAASAMKTKLDGIATGATANATDAQLRDRATHTGTQAISTVSGLQTALDGKLATSARGVANGVASLDANGLIPPMQLPSYVDDVLEYAATSNFPATGETGKIYIAINGASAADPTKQYRWTGTAYSEITSSPGSTDAVPEGSGNLYFTAARVRSTVLTGLSLASSAAVAATDTVLTAFGKIQARLNLLGTAANANVQTSAVDSTPGRALVMQNSGVGPFGLGDVGNLINDMNSLTYSGMGRVAALNTLNTPTAGVGYGIGMPHASGMSSLGGQLFLNYTTDIGNYMPWPRLFARSKASASVFGNWVEFWHNGNFDPTTKQDAFNRNALPAENQMRDSGRFAGLVDPLGLYVSSFDNTTGALNAYQAGSSWSSAGQFFHDNSTNGGGRGALTQDVIDLLAAMGRNGNALRYGVEFFVATLNTGTGTAVPSVGPDGITRYLCTTNGSQALAGPSTKITFAGWVRAKSGSAHLSAAATDTWVNGLKSASNVVLPANTWVHVRQTVASPYGYDNGFPRIYATTNAQIQFACPAFFAGEADVGIHVAPIAVSPVLKDVLPLVSLLSRSAVVGTATTRTLALTDAWNYVRPGTTSAITLTVPTNASVAFEIGTEITVRALGNVTLAAASGVTLNAPSGGTLSMTARMTVTLKKVATDVWDVIGQTVAA